MVTTNTKRANSLYTFTVLAAVASFDFGGKGDNIEIDTSALTQEIRDALMFHGLKQKVIDAGALSRDEETGKSPTPEARIAAMAEVAKRLVAGEWRVTGEGGGNSGGLLFRALTQLYPDKDVKAWLEKLDDKQKAALRANAKIAPVIDALRASSGKAASVDSDALLGELGSDKPQKGKK